MLVDPVQAELERRILFAPPGHTGPFPTYEEVRAELARLEGRRAPKAPALALAEAGFGPPVRVVVVHDLDGGLERIVPAETAVQPLPEGAKADHLRPLGEADSDAENADFGIKEITWARKPTFVEKTETYPDFVGDEASNSPSLVTVSFKTPTPSARKRTHKNDVPWPKKRSVQGHKVSKTLSKEEREWIDDAVLRWKFLKGKTEQIVCMTIKPSHLDDLCPVERMEYWEPLVNRFRSYRNSRCTVLGKPRSSWEVRAVGVRESNEDHLGEHCHTAFSFPNREEADLFIAHVQDPANSDVWGDDVHAMRISTRETMVGGKLSSFFNYMLKAAHPQSRFADHTIGWQPSGALVGKRYFITENLTDPEVIARTEVGVARLKQVREEKKLAAFRKRAREKAQQERLYRYDAAPADPVRAPAAVEPHPIEADTCLTPGSAGLVHRDEEERREMDVVEFETRLDVPTEPVPIPRELAAAAIDALVHAEDAAPPLPASVAITPVMGLATATPAENVWATPEPAPSSPKAVLAPLAAFRRSVVRGAAAGVGWIAARLGVRPALSPSSAARRPRAPLFDWSAFIAAGAFLGAPDIRSDPW